MEIDGLIVELFYVQLRNLNIPKDWFKHIAGKCISDKEHFLKMLIDNINEMEDTWGYENFTQDHMRSVDFDETFKQAWGCPKVCLCCGEPCKYSNENHDELHKCIHHRPLALWAEYWKKMNLKNGSFSCDFFFNSKKDFAFYRHIWDIDPKQVQCDYWCWFIARFPSIHLAFPKEKKVPNKVLDYCKTITKEQAKASINIDKDDYKVEKTVVKEQKGCVVM